MSDEEFTGFLARVRDGDEGAAAELVQRYEAIIRREVRLRLTDPSVYRVVDEEDICQSVLASFFIRAALGEYDLHDPSHLRGLLLAMARKKLAHAARQQHAQKRGGGQNVSLAEDALPVTRTGPSPSRVAAGRELLQEVRRRLSEEERWVADLHAQGHDWASVAQQLGGTPDGRRMQLTRALNRVSRELGLEEEEE
jgi:RNA polymerase sigma-70 factor (ECF subfamily)